MSDPKGIKRNDPDPRPVEGAMNRVAVQGKDPNKHYVWVSEANDPTLNPGSYLSVGYQMSQYDKDEAMPVLGYNPGLKQGDHMKAFGCVLMECSLERKAQLDEEGAPGAGLGQKWARQIESTIRSKDLLDNDEPMSPIERAKSRGIVTKRYGGDDRQNWGF